MVCPCKTCQKDTGTCKCVNWNRWLWIEFDDALDACRKKYFGDATPERKKPAVSYREIVFSTIFTRLWR